MVAVLHEARMVTDVVAVPILRNGAQSWQMLCGAITLHHAADFLVQRTRFQIVFACMYRSTVAEVAGLFCTHPSDYSTFHLPQLYI